MFKTVRYVEHDELTATSEVVETGEIMVFIGMDFVITVRHGGHGSLGALREGLEDEPELLAKGPSAVLHAIADHVVDDYLAVADAVQDDIDEVETEVFSPAQAARAPTPAGSTSSSARCWSSSARCRRCAARCRRSPSGRCGWSTRRSSEYFRDVADHLARVPRSRSSASTSCSTRSSRPTWPRSTVAQNEDMRKITAWAAIIAVPTMVAGMYGMNFDHMPELHWRFGYPVVMSAMVACVWASTAR